MVSAVGRAGRTPRGSLLAFKPAKIAELSNEPPNH